MPLGVLVEVDNLDTSILNVFPNIRNTFPGALQGGSGAGLKCKVF